jgi:hypothetical protein
MQSDQSRTRLGSAAGVCGRNGRDPGKTVPFQIGTDAFPLLLAGEDMGLISGPSAGEIRKKILLHL